jgi:type I restriction enzyme S subunit
MSTLTKQIKTEKLARTLSGAEGEGREPNTPTLRFKEFVGEWLNKKIREILTIGSGKDYKHLKSGDIPVYGTGGLMTKVDKAIYNGKTVFIGRKGSIDKPFYYEGEFWTVDTLFYTHSFLESEPYFVYGLFQKINWYKHNEASGVPSLSKNTIGSLFINLPSLPEQQKIASFLSAVDSKIQQLTQKKTLLEQYKKGVMQQLFKSPTSTTLSTGLERTIAKQYRGVSLRFKDGNGNAYPDWEEKRLLEFCKFFSGGTPSSTNKDYYNGEIPFIGSGNIYDSEVFNFITKEAFNSSSAKLIEKGDLLYALYGANSGESAISKLEGAINQAILCIRTDKSIEYLNYVLVSNKDKIVSKYLQGGQGNLSAQIIKKLKYKFPCFEEQQKIAAFLSSIDQKIARAGEQITQTQGFKKGLLQKMFV